MHVEFVWTEEQYQPLVDGCKDNPMLKYIFKYLPKNKPLLEAGCGLSNFVKYLTTLSYDVHGIEVSKNAVQIVNKLEPSLKVIEGTIEKMPYPDNFFGGLMSFGVIEHITEGPEKALSELYRVLEPGATALISVPIFNSVRKIKYYTGLAFIDYYTRRAYHKITKKDMDWLYKDITILQNPKYHTWPTCGGFFEYRFTKNEISNKLRNAKFEIIEEIPLEGLAGLYHEFGGKIVNLNSPSLFIRLFDKVLSNFPFAHHHTYLAIVKKPA